MDINDGVQRFYAHVFRGAERYHYGNISGLKRPNIRTPIKYCAYDKQQDDNLAGDNWGTWNSTGIFPDIRIFRFAHER